jgi:hypothetical protein
MFDLEILPGRSSCDQQVYSIVPDEVLWSFSPRSKTTDLLWFVNLGGNSLSNSFASKVCDSKGLNFIIILSSRLLFKKE